MPHHTVHRSPSLMLFLLLEFGAHICALSPSQPSSAPSTTSLPGWAGKMCTSVIRFEHSLQNTLLKSPALHSSYAFIFSKDGRTCDILGSPVNKSLDQSYYIQNAFNMKTFSVAAFMNYVVNKTLDPNFIFGTRQASYTEQGKYFFAYMGYQLTGLRFNDNYNRAEYDTASDWYINHYIQTVIEPMYPRNYFGAYSGNRWIKEPYYVATNGFEDSKTTTKKYFKCVTYDNHAGLNVGNNAATSCPVGYNLINGKCIRSPAPCG